MTNEDWKWRLPAAVCVAWAAVWLARVELPPAVVIASSAAALVCASLLLGWSALALTREASPALTAGAVATAAALPQVVSELVWAWKAAPGAAGPDLPLGAGHRALLGLGWPAAAVCYWALTGRRRILFREGSWVELLALFFAGSWAFVIALKRSYSLVDTVFLGGVLALYVLLSLRIEPVPASRPGPLAFLRGADNTLRPLALTGALAASAALTLQSWWALAEAAGAVAPQRGWATWLGAVVYQAPVLLTGLALILQDAPATGLRVLVAGQVVLSALPAALIPLAHLAATRQFDRALGPQEGAAILLTASLGFLGFLVLSGLELTLGGAAALAVCWAAGEVFQGAWAPYLVSAGTMGACVLLVALRGRGFRTERTGD